MVSWEMPSLVVLAQDFWGVLQIVFLWRLFLACSLMVNCEKESVSLRYSIWSDNTNNRRVNGSSISELGAIVGAFCLGIGSFRG